ncbi:MAG: hypothetical protein LC798_11140 [Chloroflexi bacterium]|nr:hypothetical protein [Chloroflexota bacterium]
MFIDSVIAYDANGNVLQSQGPLVYRRPDGSKLLVDYEAMEAVGIPLDSEEASAIPESVELPPGCIRGVWHHPHAAGSKVWPERIDRPHDFRVEKEGPPGAKRLSALVHKTSGYRRERKTIEKAVEDRLAAATKAAGGTLHVTVDEYLNLVADIVGLPNEPLQLTSTGRTKRRPQRRR